MVDVYVVVTALGTVAKVMNGEKTLGKATITNGGSDAAEKATAYALSVCGFIADPRVVAYAQKDAALRGAIERHGAKQARAISPARYGCGRR